MFLPKIEVLRRWRNGVKKTIQEPLFPNYLFAFVNERERLRVLQTSGIVRTLTFDGIPARLTEEEVKQMRIMQQDPGQITRLLSPLPQVGELVEVREGPFEGLRGEVLESHGSSYLVLRLQSIRQSVRVKVQAELLSRCRPS